MRWTMRGNIPKHLRDDPLRQVIRFDKAFYCQALQPWHQTPVTADDPTNQAFMCQMVQTLGLSVALSSGVHERQVARAFPRRLVLLKVKRFKCDRDFLRKADSDKAASRDCIASSDKSNSFTRGYHLTALRTSRRRQKRMLEACAHDVSSPHFGVQSPCAMNCTKLRRRFSRSPVGLAYCINQPWLTTNDCPVSAAVGKAARNKVVSAISSTVVKTPWTVP